MITSSNVAADTMLLVDAADFVSVTGDSPRFDVSRPGHAAYGRYDAIADRNGCARFWRDRNTGPLAVADRHDRRADVARPELGSKACGRRCLDANHDVELTSRKLAAQMRPYLFS